MNPQTDSYHNLLIQGGQEGRDMPSNKTDALEEFEANIESLCSDLGIEYTLTKTREITINDLFGSWCRATDSGDSLFITITGHATKTLVISRDDCSRLGQIKDFFADANLLGVAVPEAHGGLGFGLVELCVVAEQQGRTGAPVPLPASRMRRSARSP